MLRSPFEKFKWQGTDHIYTLPWIRNRLEYSDNPERIKAYLKGGRYTRSQLTQDMLSRFHLSHNSIVVSDDNHAKFLREIFLSCLPKPECYRTMAKDLVDHVFPLGSKCNLQLSSRLIPEVYLSLLSNLLGVHVLNHLQDYVRKTDFKPGTRPMQVDGLMYALGMQLPGFSPMRKIIDKLFFKGDHYTRKISEALEKEVFEYSTAKENGWYAHLLNLKRNKKITKAQFRGELTSMLVSSYTLSSAMSAMLLCLAIHQEYIEKIRFDENFAAHFVNETLRLYPPFRQFGYEKLGVWDKKPADDTPTDFMVAVFGLQRNAEFWDNPNRFHPERFTESGSTKGCKYMPFGLGKRACTGRSYSIQMLTEVLKYICSEQCEFQLSVPPDFLTDDRGLPVGASGRLVSFPLDDRLIVSRTQKSEVAVI